MSEIKTPGGHSQNIGGPDLHRPGLGDSSDAVKPAQPAQPVEGISDVLDEGRREYVRSDAEKTGRMALIRRRNADGGEEVVTVPYANDLADDSNVIEVLNDKYEGIDTYA